MRSALLRLVLRTFFVFFLFKGESSEARISRACPRCFSGVGRICGRAGLRRRGRRAGPRVDAQQVAQPQRADQLADASGQADRDRKVGHLVRPL
ncbi:MAG: zinc finger domain-containing protein [Planctomycetota bacterium]